jgi:hypothetical protein
MKERDRVEKHDRRSDWTPSMKRGAVELLIEAYELMADRDDDNRLIDLASRIGALLDRLI